MTNEKFNSEEIISEAELDHVSGGTVKEFEEICSTMSKNSFLKEMITIGTHVPLANLATKELVEKVLKDVMNVNADISLGVGGTGIFSKNNTYTDTRTGQKLNHSEVINRIKTYAI